MKMNLDLTLSFYCRLNRIKSNGECPIILRILFRGEKREIYSGQFCPPDYWNADFDRVEPRYEKAKEVNERFDKILKKVEADLDKLRYTEEEFTIDELVDMFKGKQPPPQTIMEYAELCLQNVENEVGVSLQITTFYKYRRSVRYLAEFIQSRHRQNNIPVSRVDEQFVDEYFRFLCRQKKQTHNSASAIMSCFNRLLQPAIKYGVIKRNPVSAEVLSRKPVHRGYLEMSEIQKLHALVDLPPVLEMRRDIFLFAVYTGLAYADLRALRGVHIRQDVEGNYTIELARRKTNSMSIIPMLPPAMEILKKYTVNGDIRSFRWKVPTNNIINRDLKIIGAKAGIEQKLFMHLARHTFATTITLTNGVSIEAVSKMLGHTTLKHTHLYAKIVPQKVKDEMKLLAMKFQ